ncbi:amine dehydrogenase large subunit [Ameyamaea chiangmaiensis]|nr:amine dehydrogenase large subunit [Ameyamaea chiangmaiensis]
MRAARCAVLPALTCVSVAHAGPASASDPILQTEENDIATLPAIGPHVVFIEDPVYRHAKDGRVLIVDADQGRLLGMVQAAYNANFVAERATGAIHVAETTWAHGNRGKRYDLLAGYDPKALTVTTDIELPGRALVTPKKPNMALSANDSRIYIGDMSPTNGVHVLEAKTGKLLGTIDTPGCALVYPWGGTGFSSVCADGSLVNVDSADVAKPAVTHTPSFFAPDRDPVFEHSPEVAADGHVPFISFSGLVYDAALGGTPTIAAPWSIEQAAGMKPASDSRAPFEVTWRPGGWQLAALHRADNTLYVLMHKGTFWTHKDSGTEIWVFDLHAHKLLRRLHLARPSAMVGVTQDSKPLLFTTDDDGDLFIADAQTGQVKRTMKHLGDSLVFTVAGGE